MNEKNFSFVNDWPVVYHDEKWNPMEYWNRSGTTTTQASTVSTSGKPTTPNPTSGEHTIFNLFIQKYIIAVIFYNIIYFVFIVCDITSVNSRCCIECSKVFENCQFYDSWFGLGWNECNVPCTWIISNELMIGQRSSKVLKKGLNFVLSGGPNIQISYNTCM